MNIKHKLDKAPQLEPHLQMEVNVLPRTPVPRWSYPSAENAVDDY